MGKERNVEVAEAQTCAKSRKAGMEATHQYKQLLYLGIEEQLLLSQVFL
jgi:hypothetical protein